MTHNHPEGVKGALAVTDAIFMCRFFPSSHYDDMGNHDPRPLTFEQYKTKIKERIEREHGYDLNRTLDEICPAYRFDVSCQGTVPQAIIAFLESTDFESAIRNAISLGGDSDTLAAITGSIAEAAYGIPDKIKKKALSFLDKPLTEAYERWETYLNEIADRKKGIRRP